MDEGNSSRVDFDRVKAIIQDLASTIGLGLHLPDEPDPERDLPALPPSECLQLALAWMKARRGRNIVFGSHLFSDPAWDILLDLYVSQCNGKKLSVSDVCEGSDAPMTTALRWISNLQREGLICRKADPSDKRRWFLMLTDDGVCKMEAALWKAADSDQKLGLGRLELQQCESRSRGSCASPR